MDPGAALAVLSLTLELTGAVKSIVGLFRTIREAPYELLKLIEALEQMRANLDQVCSLVEQISDARLVGSLMYLLQPLRLCEKRICTLGAFVQNVNQTHESKKVLQRTWAGVNAVSSRARLKDLEDQCRDAMGYFHFAMSTTFFQL